jgi:lipopolysaccharide/colanic/teichoic acid biosynthesis glycosyltransferase
MPLVMPILLLTAALVRLTSPGPVFFLQQRMGRNGKTFTIFKFRSMVHCGSKKRHAITTCANQQFSPVGRFLRRWKLDELPQVMNVLLGHMSLVGPRPKMPEHIAFDLPCRPGITGLATMAFATEEVILAKIPSERLEVYYRTIVIPTKWQLDNTYMSRATLRSDLYLIVNSVLRRWDGPALENLMTQVATVH